jgi:XTP/dITP diphosphohydrolase
MPVGLKLTSSLENKEEIRLKCTGSSYMKIVIATRNRNKIEEFKRILGGTMIELLSLEDFPGCPAVEEDSKTFEGNALKKAIAVARYTGMPAVSDDSGIEVYALGNAPGIKSARYAGEGASDSDNNLKLLKEMNGLPIEKRGARFVCAIAIAFPDGRAETFTGTVE